MRVDHLAFQRATNVSALGFVLQAAFGTVLLVLGLSMDDTATVVASAWALVGLVVWVGLLIVFHQHRQERLEALETDELLQTSGETAMFEGGSGVAARRLRLIYRWVLPGFSLLMAVALVVSGWLVVGFMNEARAGVSDVEFMLTVHRGWLIAVSLSFAVVSFIFSRFLAGMAEFPAWKNLRAGAGVMVGNALVMLAVAVGVAFRFFELPGVIEGVAWGLAIFMFLVAAEVVLAIVLNVYRPRTAGEYPRAGFDSRGLSLLSRPDSFVRSLNEAVNYQFGFDITSSWGYQLILRSGVWLAGLSLLSLLAMSMFVVVDGREEGLRLRGGDIVETAAGEVQPPGAFWKWPWPLEYASLFNVTEVRTLPVTPAEAEMSRYDNWTKVSKLEGAAKDAEFIVRPSQLGEKETQALMADLAAADIEGASDDRWAIIRARLILGWRVRSASEAGGGLLQYLDFGSTERARRQKLTDRERMLRAIAYGEATRTFATMNLDEVLTTRRGDLSAMLAAAVQKKLDALDAGIEVVSVDVPMVSPPEKAVRAFEDLPVALQQADRTVARAERSRTTTLTSTVGDSRFVDEVVQAVDAVDELRHQLEKASDDERAQMQQQLDEAVATAEALIRKGGGAAYQLIAAAERARWVDLLGKQGQATRVRGQQAAWAAAPELFKQRSIMQLYGRYLPPMRKYVMGVDPERLDLNIELRELATPNTVFSESLLKEGEGEEE